MKKFELLASSLAGKSLHIGIAEAGAPAHTDGQLILVTAPDDPARTMIEVVVQASLLGAGSLAPELVRPLANRPAVARRYLVLEMARLAGQLRTSLPGLPLLPGGDWAIVTPAASPEESLARAQARARLPAPPEEFGAIRPRRLLASEATAAPPDESLTKALEKARTLDHDDLPELDEDEETESSQLMRLLSNPLGGRNPLARTLQKLFGTGRQWQRGGSEGGDPSSIAFRPGGSATGGGTTIALQAPELPPLPEVMGPSTASYPEWDHHRRSYRSAWCRVLEVECPADRAHRIDRPHDRWLRRQLAPLGRGLEHVRREPRGTEVDIDAAVELRIALATGATPDESVYIDDQRRRRDLGVLVLLDVSGSSADTSPFGGTVHSHQVEAAAALLDTFAALGDRVAGFGFRSQGRGAVHLLRFKRFDDPFDDRVLDRLARVQPGAYTRFGAAVRHATRLLETRSGTSRRLLIVISDGFAYDLGYDGAYGEADARRSLEEARSRGVGCLSIGIAGGGEDAVLRRVFGASAHARVERFDDLQGQLGRLCQHALGLAEARRRLAQRRHHTRHLLHTGTTP